MTAESESRSSEIELHRAAIRQKDTEIQQLLQRLQEQQASPHQESSRRQEEREIEVAAAVEGLQAQLLLAEQAKGHAEGELAAAQLQIDKLREREEEFKRLELAAQNKV